MHVRVDQDVTAPCQSDGARRASSRKGLVREVIETGIWAIVGGYISVESPATTARPIRAGYGPALAANLELVIHDT